MQPRDYQFDIRLPDNGQIPFGQDTTIQVTITPLPEGTLGRRDPSRIGVQTPGEEHTLALDSGALAVVPPQRAFHFNADAPVTLEFCVRPKERQGRVSLAAYITDPTLVDNDTIYTGTTTVLNIIPQTARERDGNGGTGFANALAR